MVNYQNGKIYRIDCLITGEVYVGSTTALTLAKRLTNHVYDFNFFLKTGKKCTSSYKIIERGNYQITLIETYPCNSRDELNAREGYFIRTIKCVNKNISGRTRQQQSSDYYYNNRDIILNKAKHKYVSQKQDFL